MLIAPGPCGKTELRRKGDLDTTEIIKEEQHRTVDGHSGSYSGHTLKTGSVPASPPLIHRERDRRSYYTHLDRAKHKSLTHKRQTRQTYLTSCSQKAPQPKMETATSRGKCVASIPSRVTEVDPVDQIITEDINSSASYHQNISEQNEVFSKSLHVITNEPQDSDKKKDSSVFEGVRDRSISPSKMTENNLSEKEETSPTTQSFSPTQKIQRRIRVYKRKRRKVDKQVEHVKPSDIPESSILKLWDLFQSSDDMDVEFLGF